MDDPKPTLPERVPLGHPDRERYNQDRKLALSELQKWYWRQYDLNKPK